jgi:hypothetical protein
MLMTDELCRKKTSKSKVKEPDMFDGSDPKKLNNFILLCNVYFCNNFYYSDDNTKVSFSLTHLRGTALDFFEPMLASNKQLP